MRFVFILILFSFLFCNNANAYQIILSDWEYSWKDQSNWNKIKLPSKIPNRNGNLLYLKTKLPNYINELNPALFIQSVNQIFEVYIEKNKIYSFGAPENYEFKGYPFHIVPLRRAYIGKTLILKIYSEHFNIGVNGQIILGNEYNLFKNVIKKDIFKFIVGILFILIGLLFFITYIAQKIDKSFLFFSIYSFLHGVYTINNGSIRTIMFEDPLLSIYLELFSLYLLPIMFLLFIENLFNDKNILLLKIVRNINIFCFLVTYLLVNFNFLPLMTTLRYFQILISITVVSIILFFIKEKIYNHIFGRIIFYSSILLSIFTLYDIYYSIFEPENFTIPVNSQA